MKSRYFIFVLLSFIFACNTGKESKIQTANGMNTSNMEVTVIRLRPQQDLKKELENFVNENGIQAGVLLSCVGSLQMTNLRLANQPKGTVFEEKQEIVSLVGTLGLSGSHLHLSIADSTGKTIGGHLLEGCLIYTTAEIAIGILPQLCFERELDSISTYKELTIYKQ